MSSVLYDHLPTVSNRDQKRSRCVFLFKPNCQGFYTRGDASRTNELGVFGELPDEAVVESECGVDVENRERKAVRERGRRSGLIG
jgi:hypothetical protein